MWAGHILYTKELCGEVVIIKEKFEDLNYDDDSNYRNDLADFLCHVNVECGEIKLFHGTYSPVLRGKFVGDIVTIDMDAVVLRAIGKVLRYVVT